MQSIESIVLENLIHNEDYFRAVIPHLKEEYFDSHVDKTLLKFITTFSEKHNKAPTQRILSLMVSEYGKLSQDEFEEATTKIAELSGKEENFDWLVDRTEKFCKDKAIYNGIMSAIQIIDGKDAKLNQEAIPSILQDALSISFDKSVGHDYYNDADSRYEFYHEKLDRIPFGLSLFNKITKGGLPKKTLSVLLAATGVGKSLFMCDHAAKSLAKGNNVLYITLEMAEERIAERIDCNLFDCTIHELEKMKKTDFMSKVDALKEKSMGKLIIKEYPTGGAHVGHFRALLEELKLKMNFAPDIIFIDYLNICSSQRYKTGGSHNSYTIIKGIAEEVRGLAIEYNVPIMSATQTTRGGANNSDVEITDTSESWGLPQTVDMLFALMRTEELDEMGQVMVKQLKSRFNDISYYRKFVIGVDILKFKFHDVEESQQGSFDQGGKTDKDIPLFDKSKQKHDFSGIVFD